MHPPPEIRTPQEELLGTTTGIIVTAIVACLGLGALLFPVFWAARPPKERLLRKTDDGAQIGDPDSIVPSQGNSHGQWPSERLEDRHVPEGGHPHGKLSSWMLVTVVTTAFITGGVAIIAHIWWLLWACIGIAVLAIPAGKAIGIMDDTVAWGSNPAASHDSPQDHEAGVEPDQQTTLGPESVHNRIKPP